MILKRYPVDSGFDGGVDQFNNQNEQDGLHQYGPLQRADVCQHRDGHQYDGLRNFLPKGRFVGQRSPQPGHGITERIHQTPPARVFVRVRGQGWL